MSKFFSHFQLVMKVLLLLPVWFDNDPEIESKYHHYNLCLVLFNNSYLEFTRWHYYSEYVFSYIYYYFDTVYNTSMTCQLPSEMFVILQDTHFSFLYIMQPGDNLNTKCEILVTVMFILVCTQLRPVSDVMSVSQTGLIVLLNVTIKT